MASPESPTLVRQMLVPLGIFVLGAAAGAAFGTLFAADEDDRPPIIVSNGSVHLELVPGTTPTGKFVKGASTASKTTWYHDDQHGGGAVPDKMDLLISGVLQTGSTNCGTASDFFAQKIDSITASYSVPGLTNDRTLKMEVKGSRLEIEVDSAANPPTTPVDKVDFDVAGATLKSAALTGPGSKTATCMLGPTARITILQRK